MSTNKNDYPSALGAPAEHPADRKIVGPSTDPLVLEDGPIINRPVDDAPAPQEFKFVDHAGREHDTAGEAAEAAQPTNPKSERDET